LREQYRINYVANSDSRAHQLPAGQLSATGSDRMR
jgi:hypothetical protein